MKILVHRFFVPLATFCFGWFAFSGAQATHIEGTDITHNRVGPYTYSVTLKVYRDCAGITPTNTVQIKAQAIGCPAGATYDHTLMLSGPGVEVSDVAPGQTTTCSSPPNNSVHGVQEFAYTGLITVPDTACATAWEFSYSDCCRNNTVNLYQFSSATYFYTRALVIADTANANNSPLYSANPVPYVCLNDTVTYMAQATDPDGDSLVFSLISAMGSNGFQLAPTYYNSGYSPAQPFGAASPLQFDPATGFMEFVPSLLGNFVVVLQVDEYRAINGQAILVGSSQRDVQYHVVQCNTISPRLAGGLTVTSGSQTTNLAPGQIIDIEAGSSVNVSFATFSSSPGVSLTLNSNHANEIPGSAFQVNNATPFPEGTFTWSPTNLDVRTAPYIFSYHIRDDGAPVPNERYGVIQLRVSNVLANAAVVQELVIPNMISAQGSPFSATFAVPGAVAGEYGLTIYDQLGRVVYTAGRYDNKWNGMEVPGGMYIYRLLHHQTGSVYQGQLGVFK